MTWRAWAVRAALFEAFRDAVPAGTVVFDGPRPRGAPPKQFLLVGVEGGSLTDDQSEGDGVAAQQEWSSLGPGTWRDETGSVACTVIAWAGDTNPEPVRGTANAIVAACKAALLSDPTLGGVLTGGDQAEMPDVHEQEIQAPSGAAAGAVFAVAYRSLVTT